MKLLYFEDWNSNLTEVTIVNDMQESYSGIRYFLSLQHCNIPYFRVWAEEDAQLGWCIVIDYGSHSTFFKIGGFVNSDDINTFIQASKEA